MIYGTERCINVELRYEGETLWMNQGQIAELFQVDRSVASKHLANIYQDGERDPGAARCRCVVVFNPLEGWSRDASEDVAQELEQWVADGHEVTEPVREFIERFTGRPIGVQLLLPLREF
ncbi:hypothetical protein J4G48_0000230 [Bradyrhizobium barranii subsp. apii]|uniref:hypothetical protein n=1 Tax=Bradyrhizobium barranii TaxID=2992140 RepID=UPI001AA15CC8|nr:hypothetical protein [Bradyrhizobium barranii]UPT96670.1 hypothetical protein J4G48_0000230 [Bradyrhizobium barranii subsp. apii]